MDLKNLIDKMKSNSIEFDDYDIKLENVLIDRKYLLLINFLKENHINTTNDLKRISSNDYNKIKMEIPSIPGVGEDKTNIFINKMNNIRNNKNKVDQQMSLNIFDSDRNDINKSELEVLADEDSVEKTIFINKKSNLDDDGLYYKKRVYSKGNGYKKYQMQMDGYFVIQYEDGEIKKYIINDDATRKEDEVSSRCQLSLMAKNHNVGDVFKINGETIYLKGKDLFWKNYPKDKKLEYYKEQQSHIKKSDKQFLQQEDDYILEEPVLKKDNYNNIDSPLVVDNNDLDSKELDLFSDDLLNKSVVKKEESEDGLNEALDLFNDLKSPSKESIHKKKRKRRKRRKKDKETDIFVNTIDEEIIEEKKNYTKHSEENILSGLNHNSLNIQKDDKFILYFVLIFLFFLLLVMFSDNKKETNDIKNTTSSVSTVNESDYNYNVDDVVTNKIITTVPVDEKNKTKNNDYSSNEITTSSSNLSRGNSSATTIQKKDYVVTFYDNSRKIVNQISFNSGETLIIPENTIPKQNTDNVTYMVYSDPLRYKDYDVYHSYSVNVPDGWKTSTKVYHSGDIIVISNNMFFRPNYKEEYKCVDVPTPYKEGYEFLGWSFVSGHNPSLDFKFCGTANTTLKVYGNWKKIN